MLNYQVSSQIVKEASRTVPTYGARVGPRVYTHGHPQRRQPEHVVQQAVRPRAAHAAAAAVGVRDQGQL